VPEPGESTHSPDISSPTSLLLRHNYTTSIAGFIAGHVIELLLDDGYTVHGTVRDPGNKAGNAFLHDLAATRPGTLKLFAADLLDADPFTEAFAGCWGLLHIASAVARVSDDPQDTLRPVQWLPLTPP